MESSFGLTLNKSRDGITVCVDAQGADSGFLTVFYADKLGNILDCCDEVFWAPTVKKCEFLIPEHWHIPHSAGGLALFVSEKRLFAPPKGTAPVAFAPLEAADSEDTACFTFAATADIHMNFEVHARGAYKKWEKALDFYKKSGCRLVAVSGDITGDGDDGLTVEREYEIYSEIIKKSPFHPDEVFCSIGNHGNSSEGRARFVKCTKKPCETRPFEDSPWFFVERSQGDRRILLVFLAQEISASYLTASEDNFSSLQLDWFEQVMKEYDDGRTSIFVLEHAPFLEFGVGDRKPGGYRGCIATEKGFLGNNRYVRILREHPNAIMLSGHTHLSLYEGRNYQPQGEACRMIHLGSGCQSTAYNEKGELIRSWDGRYTVTPEYGSEGHILKVFDTKTVILGYNLSTGRMIPCACFELPHI